MALPEWQNTGNDGRRALIRDFAVKTRDQFETPQEQSAVLQKLWEEQGATNTESVARYVGTGIKEAALSLPSLAGAAALAAGDAVGLTDSGSGERLTQGVSSLLDQTGQRIKSLDPNDSQEVRDSGLQAFKADLDSGSAPQGVEDWLSGKPLEELDETSRTYVQSVTDALAQAAVVADHGATYSPDQVDRFRNSDRSLLFFGGQGRASARELLADYVATKDPSSWSEFTSRATETDAENTKALRDQVSAAPFEASASPDGFVDDLTRRSMSMQGSPLDLGTAVLPMLFGAKALAAAKAGNTAGAVRTASTGIATGAAEEGATTFLTDADAPLSQIASDAGLGAIGEGAFTAAGAGAGALLRDRPVQQFVSDVPPAAPPPPAAVAEAIAVSTGDPAAAEVIRQAATVAETLSTVPQGEALRADLAAVDLSTPITDSYLGLDPLEVDALEVAPAEEVTEETTTPVVEDLSVEPTPDGGFVGEVLETPETPAESPLAEAGTTQDTTLGEPATPVEGAVENVSGAQPLAETVAEPTPQDVEADEIISELNSGTDYNLQREPNPDPAAVTVAAALEGMTGRKTVFVRGKPVINGGGKAGRNTIVVNLNSRQPLRYTLGHEITHSLIGTPEYTQLSEVIKPTQGFEKYREKLLSYGYADSEIEAEFVADVVGENLANRTFWRSLSTSNPTVFQRVADTALDFIETVWNKLKDDKRPSALKYLEDLQKSRDTIREVLTGMRDRQQTGSQQPVSAPVSTQETMAQEAPPEPKKTLTEDTLRQSGANPDVWSPEARADAVAALNGDEVAFSRLNRVQKSAVGRTLRELDDGVRESRSGPRVTAPQQRFGGQTTLRQEVVREADIQSVADTLLSPSATVSNAAKALQALNSFGTSATNRKLNTAIRGKFQDYLSRIPEAEREAEVTMLRSFVYAATIGRAVEMAAGLQTKGGVTQRKTAAKLLARATAASREAYATGNLNPTSAARLLRFSQLITGGDVAAMLHGINDQIFEFVEQKTGITPQQLETISQAGEKNKRTIVEEVGLSATPQGKRAKKLQADVKVKLGALAKFLRSKQAKQSREASSMTPADRVDALIATLDADYGNIDAVLKELADIISTLPESQQVEAGRRLDEIMNADSEAAKAEKAAGGKARKLDRIADNFIKDMNAPPGDRKRVVSQDAADFAALRVQVRDGVLSPDQAAEAFVGLGGNPALLESLTEAFGTEMNNKLHEEALRQDAQKSKDLIREIGEKVAREEDFVKRVEKTANDARKKASDDIIKAVGEDVAREENFQKRISELAEAAAEKTEADARKTERAATRAFSSFDVRKEGAPRQPGIGQVIMDVINSNPEFDVSDPQDKIRIIAEVLRGKGYDAATIAEASKNAVDIFNSALEKLQRQAAVQFGKEFGKNQVSQETLFKAIRLNILNPEKGLPATVAASLGFQGLSEAQLASLYDVGERARMVQNDQLRLGLLMEQMRLVYRASGISPTLKDTLVSGLKASIYGGLRSLAINVTAPFNVGFNVMTRELGADLFFNRHQDPVSTVIRHVQTFMDATKEAFRALKIAGTTGGTIGFSAALADSNAKFGKRVEIDALTRKWDQAVDRWKNSPPFSTQKAQAVVEMVWASQRYTWTIFGALDSFTNAFTRKYLLDMFAFRDLAADSKDARELTAEFEATQDTQLAQIRYAINSLNLTPVQAQVEADTRTELAYLEYLQTKAPGVIDPLIRQEIMNESVRMIGSHNEVEGTFSNVTDTIVKVSNNPRWGLIGNLLSGPVRIPGNIADANLWWAPVFGIWRHVQLKKNRAADAAAGIKPGEKGAKNEFHLSALTDRQMNRRGTEAYAGTIGFALVATALSMQPDADDEKWFSLTTTYPFAGNEQKRWNEQGLTPYSLYLGKAGPGQKRLAISFTRGAMDYFTYPALTAAHLDNLLRGKNSVVGEVGQSVFELAETGAPALARNAERLMKAYKGSDSQKLNELAGIVSPFQPFSGLTRSVAGVTEEKIDKSASGWQWSSMFPVAALVSDAGEVELRNALNEKVEYNSELWRIVSAMGVPVSFVEKPKANPEFHKDFSAMGYTLPRSYMFSDLEDALEKLPSEQISQVYFDNGVTSPQELFTKFNAARAEAFKETYREDPKPGKDSKDTRYVEEILESTSPENQAAFKNRMESFWGRATTAAKKELGIDK